MSGAGPPQGPATGPDGQFEASFGEIYVTRTHVLLPSGTFPLAGSGWTTEKYVEKANLSHFVYRNGIPAVVFSIGFGIRGDLAMVFFALGVFLWFYLPAVSGVLSGFSPGRVTQARVTVWGPGFHHVAHLHIPSKSYFRAMNRQLEHVYSLVREAESGSSDAPTELRGASAPAAVSFNDNRSHWFDPITQTWRDTSVEIPPGAHVDPYRRVWWDGWSWRPLPWRQDSR